MYLWNDIALIEDDAYFTKWVKETGKLDHHDGFLNYLKPFLGGTMLDIGANIGTHSIFYAKYGQVLCFEPNAIAFECLKHNMRFTTARLFNVAVGGEPGYVRMSPPEAGNYGAVYTQPDNTITSADGLVKRITIDSLQLDACNFIKIDAEGDEISILQGAVETISRFRPIMCIESNPHTLNRKCYTTHDLITILHMLKYVTKQRVPEDISCDLLCEPA